MLEELQRLNYSDETIRSYIHTVEDFARRFNCPPDRLAPRHIREYQAELFRKRKLSSGTVAIRIDPGGRHFLPSHFADDPLRHRSPER
jgi:Phage integrase, N-terminal SAM-like domain